MGDVSDMLMVAVTKKIWLLSERLPRTNQRVDSFSNKTCVKETHS